MWQAPATTRGDPRLLLQEFKDFMGIDTLKELCFDGALEFGKCTESTGRATKALSCVLPLDTTTLSTAKQKHTCALPKSTCVVSCAVQMPLDAYGCMRCNIFVECTAGDLATNASVHHHGLVLGHIAVLNLTMTRIFVYLDRYYYMMLWAFAQRAQVGSS